MKKVITSHSILEEKLYIFLQNCEKCNKGPLNWETERIMREDNKKQVIDIVDTKCSQCTHKKIFYFDVSKFYKDKDISKKIILNKTNTPSLIIDIVEYTNLALFHFNILKQIITKDDKDTEYYIKVSKLCIEEALKFYQHFKSVDSENCLFSGKTKKIFKENSGAFSKKILKLHKYKINTFCDNIKNMKKIYSSLTGNKEKDRKYLKKNTAEYLDNKEVLKEIGRLMYKILPEKEKENWKTISEDLKDELIN